VSPAEIVTKLLVINVTPLVETNVVAAPPKVDATVVTVPYNDAGVLRT
jgi:hypothetical protein